MSSGSALGTIGVVSTSLPGKSFRRQGNDARASEPGNRTTIQVATRPHQTKNRLEQFARDIEGSRKTFLE